MPPRQTSQVVFLPGFARLSSSFEHWKTLLPAPVRAIDLPGHNDRPVLAEQTLQALTDHFADLIPRDALVVGELVGGLAALGLAARGWRVVVFDPPLAPARMWKLQHGLPAVVARWAEHLWVPDFVASIFGHMPDGSIQERNYWPLLDALPAPVPIFAASEPAWPMRDTTLVPTAIDLVDGFHLSRHPKVVFRRLPGQHTLLSNSVEACREALLPLIEA